MATAASMSVSLAPATMIFLSVLGMSQAILVELQNPGLRAQVRGGFAPTSALPRWTLIVLLTVMMVVLAMALAALVTRRDAFMRLRPMQRAIIGLLAVGSPLITLGAVAAIAAWL